MHPPFFVAQDRQANGCLHTNSFAGRKNMEHEVRNVRVRNRVGVSLLDGLQALRKFYYFYARSGMVDSKIKRC